MTGLLWEDKELEDLRKEWINRRADVTTREFCADYAAFTGRTTESVRMKLQTLREYKIPPSNRTPWNNPPVMEGDALVLSEQT